MTREQILEILENYKLRIPPTVFYDLKADIVNFEEPTTKNDLGGSSGLEKNSKKLEKNFGELDCISRKAILDELEKWDWQELYLPIHFKQMLDELPSVTPQEPRAGHWIEHPHEWGDNWQYSDYECSICHNWAHFDTDFCPNCGAKMAETEGT